MHDRADDEIVSPLLMWRPTGTVKSRKLTFPDVITRDTGIDTNELGFAIKNREVWRTVVLLRSPTNSVEG